jgi:putative pyruvate formate lyase activating enzyme
MEKQTRRRFMESCSAVVASGLTSAVASLCLACQRKEKSGPLQSSLERRNSKRRGEEGVADIAPDFEPAYLRLHRTGELERRAEELWNLMQSCELCPRQCGTNRIAGEKGFCGSTAKLVIAAYHPHYGEERSLVGRGGSGAIFFSNCSLRCVFCINWQISQGGSGERRRVEHLAGMMLHLQEQGCHNINLVTPTHYSAHILYAVDLAAARGLRLPLVYNTCGWERAEILKRLDGVVDIYLPDFKYAEASMAAKYSSGAESYPEITKQALLEMHRQVGVAKPAADGLMYRGLMIRHLVMPNGVSGTKRVIEWIAQNLPKETYVNIMSQYTPVYKASRYPEIARRITRQEYEDAVTWARAAGLRNLDLQGYRN